MNKRAKRPRDTNQLAKFIADVATGRVADEAPDNGKDKTASELGRLGGLKGGRARADKLSPERRSEIARKAAKARYGRKSDNSE